MLAIASRWREAKVMQVQVLRQPWLQVMLLEARSKTLEQFRDLK
jgi:hypothetical protein